MRASLRFCRGTAYFAAALLLGAVALHAQATWTNGAGTLLYGTAGNWSPATVPASNGSESIDLPVLTGTMEMFFDTSANVSGIVFSGTGGTAQYGLLAEGSSTLTIGSGGISHSGPIGAYSFVQVPVVLGASQTWDGSAGYIESYGNISSAAGVVLSLQGTVYLFNDNTALLGGVNVLPGANLYLETGGAGPGPISLGAGSSLYSMYSYLGLALPNAVSIGNNATLGEIGFSNDPSPLTLSGALSLPTATTSFTIAGGSQVAATGSLTGPSGTQLTINGSSAALPLDGGSQFIFSGSTSQVTALTLSDVAMILAPTGAPAASIGSVGASGLNVSGAYLGLDGSFVNTGAVSAFLAKYGTGLGSSINGSIGFDTTNTSGPTNVFSDPVDLSAFVSVGFQGLGSATTADLGPSAVITPAGNTYLFGGGGGTLIVQSALSDGGSPRGLKESDPQTPLTVILQGGSTYTGGTTIQGGVLIFDSNAPLTGLIENNGYVGYTEHATNLANAGQFLALFDPTNANGVIGFDSAVPTAPRTILDAIDLTAFSDNSNPFLGSATAVTLGGTITPANGHYQLTGVKGGQLAVSSVLSGSYTSTVIGLPVPIEDNGSQSAVTLSGVNTYAAGTTLNSGTLFVTNSGSLGSGGLTVPNAPGAAVAPTLAAWGGDVSLATPISVAAYTVNPPAGLLLGSASNSNMLTLTGVISDDGTPGNVGISGSVTLTAANTYTGGTTIAGSGNAALYLTPGASLGSGSIGVLTNGSIVASGGNVSLPNNIDLENQLTLGASGNTNTLALTGTIEGSSGLTIASNVELDGANSFTGDIDVSNAIVTVGNAQGLGNGYLSLTNSSLIYTVPDPIVTNLNGDSESAVGVLSGSTLTLDAPVLGNEYTFYGNLNGDATNQLIKIGPGAQYLGGTSTLNAGVSANEGILIAGSGQALGTGTVTVAAGAVLAVDSGVSLANALVLDTGSTLGGAGTFAPPAPVTIAGGTAVQPGIPIAYEPVATLTFATPLTFGQGGVYDVSVKDASGTPGSGYSTIVVTGAFTVASIPSAKFTVALTSLDPGSGNAGLASFNATLPSSMTILQATSISGFNSQDFFVDTSAFQNSLLGGSFAVDQSGNTLTLDFTPVPEPSTWALLLAGSVLSAFALRRRSRA